MNFFNNPLTQQYYPWLYFPHMEPQSSHSLGTLPHERRGRGKGGTRDRGLNQKYLEFCKYFFAYFTRTSDCVNTLPSLSPGSWKSPIHVKFQFYELHSQASPNVNPQPTFQAMSHVSRLPFCAKVFCVYCWVYHVWVCVDSSIFKNVFQMEEACYHNLLWCCFLLGGLLHYSEDLVFPVLFWYSSLPQLCAFYVYGLSVKCLSQAHSCGWTLDPHLSVLVFWGSCGVSDTVVCT